MESKLEHVLMNSYKDGMISFMKEHPACFDEAVQLAIIDTQPYSWRAAWLLRNIVTKNDSRLQPYIQTILSNLFDKKDGHQRELIKLLHQMDLEEDQEGTLFNQCVSLWEQINKQSSVRYTAFMYMKKVALKHPELLTEILLLCEDHYTNNLSPGIRRSLLKEIKDQTSEIR